ncbi:hypothetical protein EZJ43_02110 [Pedobacter changchengzhani]|uniref:Uncharacterized protein n=1 Tax=Pedobacter changchengzhani TaxID=2529274 RepID=A0A4R5MPW2_9SPHI|nr:hypothetical protein [Pedobacter changchengzhani]TDG37907.1 hypothetical protein EZJ43_02110 [Pedobacter changchengzhani]
MKSLNFLFLLLLYNPLFAQVKESYKAQIAYRIVETSPAVKKYTKGLGERVVKNGGQSYGVMLDSSPNPKTDPSQSYSKTYDFNLHESYKDRMPILARFVFDPKKQQLYEYDTVKDQLIAIAFDKSLLKLFNKK